jgi:hypothetical protein
MKPKPEKTKNKLGTKEKKKKNEPGAWNLYQKSPVLVVCHSGSTGRGQGERHQHRLPVHYEKISAKKQQQQALVLSLPLSLSLSLSLSQSHSFKTLFIVAIAMVSRELQNSRERLRFSSATLRKFCNWEWRACTSLSS